MATPVEIPRLGESVTSAILVQWLKKDGEAVNQDEAIALLETDKANVDLPAPAAGVLRQTKKAGDTVAVGEAIAQIEPAGAGAVAAAAAGGGGGKPSPTPSGPRQPGPQPAGAATALEDLSPAVRVLVQENKLDAVALARSAPGGRLTKEYVLSYLEQRAGNLSGSNGEKATAVMPAPPAGKGAPQPPLATPAVAPPKGAGASEQLAPDLSAPPKDFDAQGERRVKMSRIRQAIAKRLVQAQQTAAILTTFNEVDLTEVMELRARYKDTFEKAHGVGLGFMSFFARAVVMGLREFPRLNAYVDGDEIVYHQHINLGIAVSTDRGLAVPVLHKVESMSFGRIEAEIKRLATAVRENKLNIEELSGGTFSITNGGVFGSLLSTPILNPPQSGILGMHAIQKRPVVINDKIEIRPMMNLALSYDHRIVDGKEAISFLVRVKQSLEDPARLMLEI
jgi:2-oxoglutarate dehydrogenase E2 component (dihydrolipoamide succinyltransferase)